MIWHPNTAKWAGWTWLVTSILAGAVILGSYLIIGDAGTTQTSRQCGPKVRMAPMRYGWAGIAAATETAQTLRAE